LCAKPKQKNEITGGIAGNKPLRRRILQIGLGALALTALVLGIVFDQHTAVLRKAIYVCLECIGLG